MGSCLSNFIPPPLSWFIVQDGRVFISVYPHWVTQWSRADFYWVFQVDLRRGLRLQIVWVFPCSELSPLFSRFHTNGQRMNVNAILAPLPSRTVADEYSVTGRLQFQTSKSPVKVRASRMNRRKVSLF